MLRGLSYDLGVDTPWPEIGAALWFLQPLGTEAGLWPAALHIPLGLVLALAALRMHARGRLIVGSVPLPDTDLGLLSERLSAHVVAAVALEDVSKYCARRAAKRNGRSSQVRRRLWQGYRRLATVHSGTSICRPSTVNWRGRWWRP